MCEKWKARRRGTVWTCSRHPASTAQPPESFRPPFSKGGGVRGRAPKPYLCLPKMQEGKEKQSGGLFFRRGTHTRGPPRTAAGGAHFATLPDCRTQRPVFTWLLNFDFPVRKNRKIEVQSANRRRRGASRSGRGGPPFLAAKKWGKEPRGALPLRTPRFLFYVRLAPPFPRHGRPNLR